MNIKGKGHGQRLGFSLVELCIVMGVIGIVSAGIWAAASTVKDRQAIQDMAQVPVEIATLVRGAFSGHPNAVVPMDTLSQIGAGLFPANILNPTRNATMNAWGGSIDLVFPPVAPRYGFSVRFNIGAALPASSRRGACMGLLSRLPGSATNYAATGASTTGVLPDVNVRLEPQQGDGPALIFANSGGNWVNVTGWTMAQLSAQFNVSECLGVAFYYKM